MEIETRLEQPVFGVGAPYLLALLPLEPDLTVSWPSFSIVEEKLVWNSATVIGRDSVEVMGRPTEAWKVTTQDGKATLWIRQQPPYVLRREFHVNEELTIVWQIVEYPYTSQ